MVSGHFYASAALTSPPGKELTARVGLRLGGLQIR